MKSKPIEIKTKKRRNGIIGLVAVLSLLCLVGIFNRGDPNPSPAANPLPTRTARPTATSQPTTLPERIEPATETPELANTPPPTPTVAATQPPAPIVRGNANIRSGPGTDYPIISSASVNEQIDVIGQNTAGDWLQLAGQGWIFAELVDNVPSDLPTVAAAAAPPAATPVPARSEPVALPTAPGAPVCQCSGDAYNCGDFGSWRAAQDCFEYCMQSVGYDVHGLDGDNNGFACESMR